MQFFNSLSVPKYIAKILNTKDKSHDNFTALHHAVVHNQEEVVSFILAQPGIQVNAKTKTKKSTALHLLVHHLHFDLLDLFIDYRQQKKQNKKQFACLYMNPKDKDGKTPLYYFQKDHPDELDQYKAKWDQLLGKKSKSTKPSMPKQSSDNCSQQQVQPSPRTRTQPAVSATSQLNQQTANKPGYKKPKPTNSSQKQLFDIKQKETKKGNAPELQLSAKISKKPLSSTINDNEGTLNPVSVARDQRLNPSTIVTMQQSPEQNSNSPAVLPITESTVVSAIDTSQIPFDIKPNETKKENTPQPPLPLTPSASEDKDTPIPVSVSNDHKSLSYQVMDTSAKTQQQRSISTSPTLTKTSRPITQVNNTTTEDANLFHYLQYLVAVLLLGSILYLVLFN